MHTCIHTCSQGLLRACIMRTSCSDNCRLFPPQLQLCRQRIIPPCLTLLMNAPGAPSSKDAAAMNTFLQEQLSMQRSREIILKITETCWDQCISADGKVLQPPAQLAALIFTINFRQLSDSEHRRQSLHEGNLQLSLRVWPHSSSPPYLVHQRCTDRFLDTYDSACARTHHRLTSRQVCVCCE